MLGPQDIYCSGQRSRVDSETAGVEFIIHYLDDFLVVTTANKLQGSHAMRLLLETRTSSSVGQAGGPITVPNFHWVGVELNLRRDHASIAEARRYTK